MILQDELLWIPTSFSYLGFIFHFSKKNIWYFNITLIWEC
jgi:hypothetical protein